MSAQEYTTTIKLQNLRKVFGVVLITAGAVLFLDRYLKTGWLSLAILPAVGLFLYLWGIKARHVGMIIAGGLISGFGAGVISAWGLGIQVSEGVRVNMSPGGHPLYIQIGLLALYSGISWGLVVMTTLAVANRPTWWGLVPGGVLAGLGACLLFTPMRVVDFVLYLLVGAGLPLLFWGLIVRLFGLVIPGCLLTTIGGGIYSAWRPGSDAANTLVQTGIMLIWFAVGWALISAAGRVITQRSIWWPLIPGGILAMVGMGLYIGGDPKHALGFIGNTGSIALMIFGLYLLLMRKSIHH
jgi:hypothetical protein